MRLLTVFLFAFTFIACNRSPNNDIIPLGKMKEVCWDMMQADEWAQYDKQNDSSLYLKVESFKKYNQVFAVHSIDPASFYKSYKYYQERPKLYKALSDSIRLYAQKRRNINEAKLLPAQ